MGGACKDGSIKWTIVWVHSSLYIKRVDVQIYVLLHQSGNNISVI